MVGIREVFADTWFSYLYFQEPGVAEAELEANLETLVPDFVYTMSGDADRPPAFPGASR